MTRGASVQGKDKERKEKDKQRSADRATPDGKEAAEKDAKATASGVGTTAGDAAAAVVSNGDKGDDTAAAGEPATVADAAAGLPEQEAANGTAPMDTDAPGDKVISSDLGISLGC